MHSSMTQQMAYITHALDYSVLHTEYKPNKPRLSSNATTLPNRSPFLAQNVLFHSQSPHPQPSRRGCGVRARGPSGVVMTCLSQACKREDLRRAVGQGPKQRRMANSCDVERISSRPLRNYYTPYHPRSRSPTATQPTQPTRFTRPSPDDPISTRHDTHMNNRRQPSHIPRKG